MEAGKIAERIVTNSKHCEGNNRNNQNEDQNNLVLCYWKRNWSGQNESEDPGMNGGMARVVFEGGELKGLLKCSQIVQ
jgi:hypothetical protein